MANKEILVAVNSLAEAFESSLSGEAPNVIYIKMADLKDWAENKDLFETKEFGAHDIGLKLSFIYKEGDTEFNADNLVSELVKFKILNPKLLI
jgi:hypothetical protein